MIPLVIDVVYLHVRRGGFTDWSRGATSWKAKLKQIRGDVNFLIVYTLPSLEIERNS